MLNKVVGLMAMGVLLAAGCDFQDVELAFDTDDSSGGDYADLGDENTGSAYTDLEILDGDATDITITYWCNDWTCPPDGHDTAQYSSLVIGTSTLPKEGPLLAEYNGWAFATADEYFTQLIYTCTVGLEVNIDLDRVETDVPGSMAGVVFADQEWYQPGRAKNTIIAAYGPGGLEFEFFTDEEGRYAIGDLPEGTYDLEIPYNQDIRDARLENTAGLDYKDIFFMDPAQMM